MKTRKPTSSAEPPVRAPWPGRPGTMAVSVRQVLQTPRPQAKLTLSRPDDAAEREADQVADHVLRLPEPGADHRPDHHPVSDRADGRSPGDEVQRRSTTAHPASSEGMGRDRTVPEPLAARLSALARGGQPLTSGVREFFEPRFGRDLSHVRLHTDPAAGELARSLDARAFTLGSSIAFGSGEYAPGTVAGRHLIAHELTHVLQQTRRGSLARGVDRCHTAILQRQVASEVEPGLAVDEERDGDSPTAARIDGVDGFLAARVGLFQVVVWGSDFVAILDRAQNPWSERYTPAALTAAAVVAVVHHLAADPPDALRIDEERAQLLRDEPRYRITAPETLRPAAVDPTYHSSIDRGAVRALLTRSGITLSGRGRQLEAEAELGEVLEQRLIEVARDFGSVRSHLEANAALDDADLTPDHVFDMVTVDRLRRTAAQLAKAHRATEPLREDRTRDWTALTPATWADLLADIAVQVVEGAGRAALERQERERRYELNERLRPHQLTVEDSAQFILEEYDPDSAVTVDFLGPVELKGGETIVGGQGHRLFILRAGSRVIYQNLSDHQFYAQSASGVQQELRFGVFALVAEQTRHIIPVMQFATDVIAAIFPPARLPYLAVTVLNAGSNFTTSWDELMRLVENVQISRQAIDELLPDLLGAAAWGTASRGLGEILNPKHSTAAPRQVLLLALRIVSAAVRGSAAGRAAGEAGKAAWAEIRKELLSIGGILAQFKVLVSRELTDDLERHIERLVEELNRLIEGEGRKYARMIQNMDEAQLGRLVREMDELATNGTALFALIASCFDW